MPKAYHHVFFTVRDGTSDDEVIEQFYLAALTRFPSPRERTQLLDFMRQRSSRRQEAVESLVWGIISSREFAYNH